MREILRVIVDDLIGPETPDIVHVGGAGRGDDVSAEVLGELNGEAGDAARATLISIVSPRCSFSVSSTESIAVRPVSASAAAFTCDSPLRLLGDDRSPDGDLLGSRSLPCPRLKNAEHRIANLEIVDAGAKGANGPGEIPAREPMEISNPQCRAYSPARNFQSAALILAAA